MDRDRNAYQAMSKVERASRLLYLNKTCFNGLFRVNSAGEFNAPFGHYKNPNIVNEPVLRAVNKYFSTNNIKFYNEDFEKHWEELEKVDLYIWIHHMIPFPIQQALLDITRGIWKERANAFKKCCDELTERGIKFMLSNSATDFIKELYKDYNVDIVKAKRMVNSDATKRGAIEEVLIRNYGTE